MESPDETNALAKHSRHLSLQNGFLANMGRKVMSDQIYHGAGLTLCITQLKPEYHTAFMHDVRV